MQEATKHRDVRANVLHFASFVAGIALLWGIRVALWLRCYVAGVHRALPGLAGRARTREGFSMDLADIQRRLEERQSQLSGRASKIEGQALPTATGCADCLA